MAITNHSELVAAAGSWLHRGDLTAIIPDFIVLAEAKLNRILRLRAMEVVATGAVAATVPLPAGFIELKSLTITQGTTTKVLTYIPPTGVNGTSGIAQSYSLVGDDLKFIPIGAGETYTMTYYAKLPALSAGVNWLITNAPDCYLYATLLESAPFIGDDPRTTLWLNMLTEVIKQLEKADRDDRYGSDLVVRPA